MKPNVIFSAAVSILLIAAAIYFTSDSSGGQEPPSAVNNVSEVDGKQTVDITARGGYQPRRTVARAGVPTVIRVETKGTYDCSAALRVPSAGFQKFLPATGVTEIPLPAQEPGAVVRGLCSMGMYSFEVEFQ